MTQIQKFSSSSDLKQMLNSQYKATITNFLGNEKNALKFMSAVMAAVQRNKKLLECTPDSVINAFLIMAQLSLLPSDVAGEAYVIPYKDQAQFQLGYKGLVTLFYRAGIKKIVAEIIREKDKFSFINHTVHHEMDVLADDRGKALGAYVIVTLPSGMELHHVMSQKAILGHAKQFSKSFNSDNKSPWKEKEDPQLWMWKKTVLRQIERLIPKEDIREGAKEQFYKAIEQDNKDSVLSDRLSDAIEQGEALKLKNTVKEDNKSPQNEQETKETKTPSKSKDKASATADLDAVLDTIGGEVIDGK